MPTQKSRAERSSRTSVRPTKTMRVGGSIVAAIPAHILEELAISVGTSIKWKVERGRLIATPVRAQTGRTGVARRLAKCDFGAKQSASRRREDDAWLDDAPQGREEI